MEGASKGGEKETEETSDLRHFLIGKDPRIILWTLSVFTRGLREVFLWQWLHCDGRITHTCRQVPGHALCVSPSSSPSKSSALATACRWAQPRPSQHTLLSTPGGHCGEQQPGTRRPSFQAWRLSCNLGDTRYFFLRKRPRLSVQDTARGCQPPKQVFWVRTKKTWRVKNHTKTIACVTNGSPWKGEEFWCARHVEELRCLRNTAQSVVF